MTKLHQQAQDNTIPIKVGDYTICLRSFIATHKKSVILVHGLGVSGDYYTKYATALARYYNVYVIDLPGYGATPKPSKPLNIRQLSNVLVDFINEQKITNFILIGQSMGCQIIAQAGLALGDSCKQMILVGPTVNKNERTLALQSLRLLQDTFREPLKANGIVFGNYLRMGVRRFMQSAGYMVKDHIEDALRLNTVPLLLVRGSNDIIVPKNWFAYLQDITPLSTGIEIPEAPHLAHYTHAQQLTNITQEFIES